MSLELMMKRQLELRREETRAIHEFVQSEPLPPKIGLNGPTRAGNVTRWRHSSRSCAIWLSRARAHGHQNRFFFSFPFLHFSSFQL